MEAEIGVMLPQFKILQESPDLEAKKDFPLEILEGLVSDSTSVSDFSPPEL